MKTTLAELTRNGPTTYYEGADGPAGLEYDLAKMFADQLGVKLAGEAGLVIERDLGGRFSVEAHGSVVRDKYLVPALAGLIDRSKSVFGARFSYRVLPKTKVYAGFDRGITHYSAGRGANSSYSEE